LEGKQKGLSLDLFIGKRDDYKTMEGSRSAKVFIYNHSNHYSESEVIDISGGFETNIVLSKRISETYPKPYSTCEIKDNIKLTTSSDYKIFGLFANSSYSYRSLDCHAICYQEIILDNCKCIDKDLIFINLKNIKIPRLCNWYNNSTDWNCYNMVLDSIDSVCKKMCPYECNQVKLSMSTSFKSLFDGSQYLKVNIYFSEISYEFSTENPAIRLSALFGGIGGNIGKPCCFQFKIN
jgi:hypothetical protein